MNSLFDIDLGVKVTWNIAQYPLHHVTYVPAKFEVLKIYQYSKNCVKRPLKNRQNKDPNDKQ